MMNPILRAILERRSSVEFKASHIDERKIQSILEAGRWAPSYANTQPWEFIVVTDMELKHKLCESGAKVTLFSGGIEQASAIIVVVVDPEKDSLHYIEDGSVATQNMALAAHSIGLASYWIGIFDLKGRKKSAEKYVKKVLRIPEKLRVIALLPIGEPASSSQSDRKWLKDLVHHNYYQEC